MISIEGGGSKFSIEAMDADAYPDSPEIGDTEDVLGKRILYRR